jgi:hypothetical protein
VSEGGNDLDGDGDGLDAEGGEGEVARSVNPWSGRTLVQLQDI